MKVLKVEREKIKHNILSIKEKCGLKNIFGVLKCNGYGLGTVELARIISEEGIKKFAVVDPKDALALRNAGFNDEEILVLRCTSLTTEINTIIEACATAAIGSYDSAVALNGLAEKNGLVCDAHIEIDTGMGRYGFLPNELERILSIYQYMPNINVTGIFTHFHSAFSSKKITEAQLLSLMWVVNKIKDAGIDPGVVHASNSAALFKYGDFGLDAVRVGSAITGRIAAKGRFNLKRAGHLESNIIDLRWLPKKHTVGYGGAFVTKKPTKIAVIPAGYGDGFMVEKGRDIYRFRDFLRYSFNDFKKWVTGGRFYVIINGKRARVLGHVGISHTVADVTDIECAIGDTVMFSVSPTFVPPSVLREYV